MANVLSQDEIDSLLGGISDGKVKTETDVPEQDNDVDFKKYDFGVSSGSEHLRMPTLKIIHERFVGILRTSLSKATGAIIDVNIAEIDSVRFGDFCLSLPLPSSLNIYKMEPFRGFALLILEGPLVFAFVDTFFGGDSFRHVKLEGRSFTSIELRIIEKITKIALLDLNQAWESVHKVNMVFTRSEIDPQFAAIVTPDDKVITIKCNVDLNNASGTMTLCLPYSTLEPLRDKLRTAFGGENMEIDQVWKTYFENKMKEMRVNLDCTLGMASINGRELLEMKTDDVIQLDQKIGDPITICVEDIQKYEGFPGTYNNMRAIRISDIIKRSK